jgi:predicted GNAT superfamily acetyltransferase
MKSAIRDVRNSDLDTVLSLNEAVVPHVNSIDFEKMAWFAENAHYFRIAEVDGAIVGMLVGFRPGSSYESPFYRWFCARYPDFAYIDRVAVAADMRRAGIARQLYEDFEAAFHGVVPMLTCEVNVLPPNPTSRRFHEKMGFAQVDLAIVSAGEREVARLLKELRP